MSRIEAVRGTQDLLPEDTARWQEAERRIRDVLTRYGFGEIRTPVFEHAELFRRSLGLGSDVVAKEMYEFTDKGDRQLALRPEGTASVVRAFIEHSLPQKGGRHKLYYVCPVFRYDRPQKGRFREHHQVGVEVFGNPAPSQDVEVMDLGDAILGALGVSGFERRINSNGDPACRPAYEAALRAFVEGRKDRFCKDCAGYRLEHNVLRVLDCKVEACRAATADAPKLVDHLCDACRAHHETVLAHLRTLGLDVVPDPRLVRGLDYYTRTCFEYVPKDAGQQGTLLGGGRYDGLVELLGGPPTPGVGFGMGLERVLDAAPREPAAPSLAAFVLSTSVDAYPRAFRLAQALRRAGVACELGQEGKSLNSQLRASGSSGAGWAVFVAPGTGSVGLKNLATHVQEDVAEGEVAGRLAPAKP
ncbi:MAG: histidine--tRNA ligase [Candidatus Coatesbacteria bacterium]